ncbi:uncharacterized protein LOC134445298 [Engraulis encrasicolus]|uniref:uncharacterized protein LOC134445298 n=1 Tax=Engraulis encrasicolus TaxID=184585 RepID=UPI002FD4D646
MCESSAATDPDVWDTETLQYSLAEPNSMFDIKPSSGQVYVASSLKNEKMKSTLTLKVLDAHELGDTALVELLQKASSYQTNIDIVAMEDTVILYDYQIEKRLYTNAPAIQEDLEAVFGPDVDFEVGPFGPDVDFEVGPSGPGKGDTDVTSILLGILIPIAIVSLVIAFIHRASPHMSTTLRGLITDASTYLSQGTSSSTHSNVPANKTSMYNASIRADSCPVGPLPNFRRSKQRPHVGEIFPSVFKKIGPPHRIDRSKQRPHAGEIFPTIVEHPEPELEHPSSTGQDARGLIDTRTSSLCVSQGTYTHSNRSLDCTSTQNDTLRGGSILVGPFSEPTERRSVCEILPSVADHPKPEVNQLQSSVGQDANGLINTSTSSAYASQGTPSSAYRSSGNISPDNGSLRGGCTWVGPLSEPSP